MANFVSDDCTNTAVVDRIVGLQVEEWGLQNRGWKYNFIEAWIVISVDGLRCHEPLGFVDRLAKFIEIAMKVKLMGAADVAYKVIAFDFQRGVIAPLIGVSDFWGKFGEFL